MPRPFWRLPRQFLEQLADRDDHSGQRYKKNMLSAILLGLIGLVAITTLGFALLAGASGSQEILIRIVVIVALTSLYVLDRNGRHALSAVLLILISLIGIIALVLIRESDPFAVLSILSFLNVVVLLSSALLPLRWTIAVAGFCLFATIVLVLIRLTGYPPLAYFMIFQLNGVLTLFIVIIALVRHRDQQQLAQQAHDLRAGQERYRHLFEAISDPIYVHTQGSIIDVNPAFERVFQYSRDEIVGTPAAQWIGAESAAGPETQTYDLSIYRKDGTGLPMEVSSRAYSHNGSIMHVTVARDLTTRRQIEQVIEAERNLLRTVIDNIPDFVYVKDLNHQFVLVNAALEAEWDHRQLIGKTDYDLTTAERADAHWAAEERIFESGRSIVNQEMVVPAEVSTHSGPIWLQITKVPLRDSSGKITGLVGINRQITHQKEFEQKLALERNLLRTVIDNIPDYVYLKDTNHRFLLVNKALQDRRPDIDMIGKTDHDIMEPSFAEIYLADEERIMRSGEASIDKAYYVPPDMSVTGDEEWLLQTKIPLRDTSGKVTGLVGINRNITQQKVIEEKLENERRLLRTVIDNLPDSVYIKDTDSRFIMVNQTAIDLYPDYDFIGKTDFDIFPEEMAREFLVEEARIFATGMPIAIQELFIASTISPYRQNVWFQVSKVPLRDSTGRIIGLLGINRDITELKQIQIALTEERNLLRTVIDNIPDHIYVKNRDHRFALVNRALRLRFNNMDLIGKTDHDTVPDDAPKNIAEEQRIMDTGEPVINDERHYVRADGTPRWLTFTKLPLRDSQGNITGVVGIVHDITPLKQIQVALTEERNLLRAVIDNIPERIYIKDLEYRFMMANKAQQERWLRAGVDNIIGKTDVDLHDPADAQAYQQNDKLILHDGQTITNAERSWIDENGQEQWMLVSKFPLYDFAGKITGMVGIHRDITERKLAELELTRERNLLSTVIDNIPEHIYVKDRDHRVILANQASQERWGRSIIGLTDADLLPPEQAESTWAQEEAIFETGEPVINLEYRTTAYGTPEALVRWMLINRVPLRDQNGQIVGLVGITQDITDLKLAELKLKEERNLLRSVIDTIPDEVYVKDMAHRLVLVNQALITDWRRSDLIGKCDIELGMSPETAEQFRAQEEAILASGRPILNEETLVVGQDGTHRWYGITKVALHDGEGRVVGLVGVNRDVTERKQFEEQLRYHASLLENVSDAVISTDMNFKIVSWNKGAEEIYGWRAEEVIGKPGAEIIAAEYVHEESLQQSVIELLQNGYWTGEVMHPHRDGRKLHIFNVTTLIKDDRGEFVGTVAVNRDITERRLAEQQQLELVVERERVKILQQVISDMSHDLKNPLANVRTSLYLLERFIDHEARRRDYLAALDSHTVRLEAMLDDLLSMARLEQATDEFHFEQVQVCTLVRQLVADQQPLAGRRNQMLVMQDCADLPPIQADPLKLSRAVTNLVMNALNYTPEGGVVAVGIRTKDHYLVIDVRDNGIGISRDDQELIFERFYRVDKARSSSTGGTGLGLSITRRIAEAHRGKITVESTPGEGSLFSIWLPVGE